MKVLFKIIIAVCFFWTCTTTLLYGQQEHKYTFVNLKQNITKRAISTITQDHEGFMWIGTNSRGLYKFDGTEYTLYEHIYNDPTTLNSSIINCVYLDKQNNIWVGTETGLNLYNRELDQFITIDLEKDQYKKIGVYSMIDAGNGLLIGTHEHGAFYVDKKERKVTRVAFGNKNTFQDLIINSIVKDNNQKIILGSNKGLLSYNQSDNSMSLSSFTTNEGATTVSEFVETLLIDKAGVIWIGTVSKGLIKITMDNDYHYHIENYPFTSKRILALLQTPENSILCGTENDGLFLVDHIDGSVIHNYRYNKFDKNSIKSNSIWSLFLDQQQRIWMGYYNNGIGVYDQFYDKFSDIESLPNLPNSLQSNSVTAITKAPSGNLWFGMDGGGVDIYNPKNKEFIHLADPTNGYITGLKGLDVLTIFIDSKGNSWVGTWDSGIYFLPKGGNTFINYNVETTNGEIQSNRILSFAEDSKGTIWFGTFLKGLHSYTPDTQKFTAHNSRSFENYGIINSNIRKILVDSNDHIWVGTTKGLYQIIAKEDQTFDIISITEKMSKDLSKYATMDLILTLYEDKQQHIWIGTDGDGLFKFDPKKDVIKWYYKTNGLRQETVSSIIEADDNSLWVGGNKGLSKINMTSHSITNYSTSDGLLFDDFNNNSVFKDTDGTLYFGGYEGINYFNPDKILINYNVPSVYFSDLKLSNTSVVPNSENAPLEKVISATQNITLNPNQQVLTIEYSGINYTRPEKTEYAYYMDGFEDKWNYVGNTRSATYTNLAPGNYTFKVKAANNDGIWNENPITLHIKILPPWWKTNIAICAYILFLLLLAYTTYRIISGRVREKRLIKYERDKRIQEEALNAKKIQFFTNISHEFRTPLTLILNPLEDIITNSSHLLSDSLREKHKIIYKNTNRLKHLIDELMDFRKLQYNKITVNASEISIIPFVKEVTSYFDEEASERNIMLAVESDLSPLSVWADPGMLEKIIFNILSNAFKVTPEHGAITVSVFRSNKQVILPLINEKEPLSTLEIRIEDTGSGIKKEEISNIFERFYQAKEMNKQYYGGTGIGLEVVRNFIDLHKGKILVESKEGVGTTFKILLALGKEHFDTSELFVSKNIPDTPTTEVSETETPQKAVATPTLSHPPSITTVATTTNKKKKTLLIAEDNSELRNYLKNELKDEYIIIEATNGREAFDATNKMIPDAIITDVLMPELNGYEFCSLLKKDLKTSHIPILMLTAKAMSDDWVKGIESGADVYINKPFEMKILRSQLKQLINSRQILFNKYVNTSATVTTPSNTTSLDKEFILKVLKYINENLSDTELSVENLAEELFLSRSQLYRKIKALTGQTANEFLRKVRLEKAKEMIESGNDSIGEISYKVGFSSPSYFTKCFKSQFGILPTEINKPN